MGGKVHARRFSFPARPPLCGGDLAKTEDSARVHFLSTTGIKSRETLELLRLRFSAFLYLAFSLYRHMRRILNDREKLEAAREVIRKMNWYQSPDEWGRIAAVAPGTDKGCACHCGRSRRLEHNADIRRTHPCHVDCTAGVSSIYIGIWKEHHCAAAICARTASFSASHASLWRT